MNKYLIKANDHWRKNDIKTTMCCYNKALHCADLQPHESNIAHYMLAYLNGLLARRMIQEQASMGVDLRHPYHDHYLDAARHYHEIDQSSFSVDILALPAMDSTVMSKIEQAWDYWQQLQQICVASWLMRLKAYAQTYMLGVWHKVQQQMHA